MMYYHNAWEDLGMHVSFKAIGRNIRAARTELGITQEDAAERLKISQLHFGRLERGERPASLEMLAKIAGVFGVSLTSLLNGCLIGEGRAGIARPAHRLHRQRLLAQGSAADA